MGATDHGGVVVQDVQRHTFLFMLLLLVLLALPQYPIGPSRNPVRPLYVITLAHLNNTHQPPLYRQRQRRLTTSPARDHDDDDDVMPRIMMTRMADD